MTNPFQKQGAQPAPYSQEIEEAVLGALLTNPAAWHTVSRFLCGEDFFLLRHQWIWRAIERIAGRGEDYDFLTVAEELKAIGQYEDAGGQAYLLQLVNNTPSSAMVEVYGKVVQRAALRRKLLIAAEEIKALALDEALPLERIQRESESRLLNVLDSGYQSRTVSMADAVARVHDHVDHVIETGEIMGLPTGFGALDNLLHGLQPGDFVLIGGRPGMGKSALLLSLLLNVLRWDKRVFLWSGEMGSKQIAARALAGETAINSARLKSGALSEKEYQRFVEASGRVARYPIWIDDTPGLTVAQLRSMVIRHTAQHGMDLLVLDYIGLMREPRFLDNPTQEVSYISTRLKELARELNIPIVCAAQLNRNVEQRQNKRPTLADLRQSGSLEQDADVVMFLYRDEVYNEATDMPGVAEIIVAKQRDGATDTVYLAFDKATTRFYDARTQQVSLRDKEVLP